jgi:hypothetical protein
LIAYAKITTSYGSGTSSTTYTETGDCEGSTFVSYDYNDYDSYEIEPLYDSIEIFQKEIERLFKIYKSQWILRQGFKFRFDVPKKIYYRSNIFFRKILRCNRKGIGLRLKFSK